MELMKSLRFVIIVLITLTTLSMTSYGREMDSDEGTIFVGPQLGIFNAIDADDANFMGGVAARLKFARIFGVEASINYRQENYFNNSVTVKNWPIMVTGLVYPIPFVYGGIGVGWYNANYTYNNNALGLNITSNTQQSFGWHFAGGVDIPVGDIGKFVGDIRYVFLDYEFEEFPGSDDANADFYVFMIGFLFKL